MPESHDIEYKASWHDDYLKWISGFANANGGKLYIGVDDNGKVVGIGNYRALLEQLPNKLKDLLGVFAEINLKGEGEKHYLEIIVSRYEVPISLRGKYYVRIGSTLQEIHGIALNEFILKRTGKTWDEVIEERATIDDIDPTTISRFIRDAQASQRIAIEPSIEIANLLEKLRLMEGGRLKRAAIILFGKDPGRFYNSLAVKIGKFGETDADLRHHEVVEGNLVQLKDSVPQMLNAKFLIHPIDFAGMQRIERDEYPAAALREMILNALVHRSYIGAQTQIRIYDDYLQVWNDGGLPEGISEEDLRRIHSSKPRNPLIADVCFKAGYIDSWGRGTIKIIESCEEAGLPEPELIESQGGFLSRVSKQLFLEEPSVLYDVASELNDRQLRALEYLEEHKTITNSTYQEINSTGRTVATRELRTLVDQGILKQIGSAGRGSKFALNN